MYKVFIVDNEKVIISGLLAGINWKSLDCEVCGTASDGEEALARIESAKPDIVITDVKMDPMDGITLTTRLQEKMPEIRCIIMTGYQEFKVAQTAANLQNITRILLKPTSVFQVTEAVNYTIGLIGAQRKHSADYEEIIKNSKENLKLKYKFPKSSDYRKAS